MQFFSENTRFFPSLHIVDNFAENPSLHSAQNRVYYKEKITIHGGISLKKLKSLSPILKAHTKDSVLAPTLKFLEVVFDLLVPVVVAQMIDVGVAKGDKPYILRCFFLLLVMAAVGLTCTVTAQFFAAKASVGFAAGAP